MDRSRRIALVLLLTLGTAGQGWAQARPRAPIVLEIERVEGSRLAGDPVTVAIALTTTSATPVVVHFARRQLAFGLNPESAQESLCEPAAEAREATRREFVTVKRDAPYRVRVDLSRHCPSLARVLGRPGVNDLRVYYDARLDGWQWGLHAWKGRLLSDPVSFSIVPRFGPIARGTSASQRLLVYTDTDKTLVLMPQTAISADVADRVTVGASYMADVVSSASVDVTTSASRRFEERRDQIGIGTSYAENEARAGLSLTYSLEPDFESAAVLATGGADFLERNLTISGEYQLRRDDLGVNGDDPLPFSATGHRARIDALQLLDARSFIQVGLSGTYQSGFLSNPYRFVPVGNVRLRERVPDEILRGAVAARYARLLAPGHSARLEYRFYLDDWGIFSHTAEARYHMRLGAVVLRFQYRFYRQDAASFYQGHYQTTQTLLTGDRELGAFTSHEGGVELAWSRELTGFVRRVGFEAQAQVLHSIYDDFELTPHRTSFHAQLALNAGI